MFETALYHDGLLLRVLDLLRTLRMRIEDRVLLIIEDKAFNTNLSALLLLSALRVLRSCRLIGASSRVFGTVTSVLALVNSLV